MFGKQKGQAAVEYLVILAVVIIIALVVVAILGGFPTLTSGVNERQSALYWQGSDIGIERVYANATGAVFGVVRNNKNFNIRAINVSDFGTGVQANAVHPGTLAPGQTTDMVLLGTLAAGTCSTTGQTFQVQPVSFVYFDQRYNTQYTFTGAEGLAGTCQ